ncbi:MAG: sigma-70 family RNA polymerase sigma factor [Candidatus Zixiibacteriota bacterium]|nr:MAG: sigma-70 family RNA polymerase sigma factor [candidate division Zixibacteria bacterium]
MNENQLVKLAQAGDFDAFNLLIVGHKDKIYRLAMKLTGNREDAEDIVQETFLKAIDNIDKFRRESSFGTWLYAIALNNIKAQAGDRKKMTLKPIEEYLPGGHEAGAAELFDWGDPHKLFEQKQLQKLIESSLAKLPHKYSVPFILRYIEEMSIDEVAAAIKLSVAATKSRIMRARLALREMLSEVFKERANERVQ